MQLYKYATKRGIYRKCGLTVWKFQRIEFIEILTLAFIWKKFILLFNTSDMS